MKRRNIIILASAAVIVIAVGLWFWPPNHVTITIIDDGGAQVVTITEPPDRQKPEVLKVVAELKKGDVLEVYDVIYGKDFLMYEVRVNGSVGYIESFKAEVLRVNE